VTNLCTKDISLGSNTDIEKFRVRENGNRKHQKLWARLVTISYYARTLIVRWILSLGLKWGTTSLRGHLAPILFVGLTCIQRCVMIVARMWAFLPVPCIVQLNGWSVTIASINHSFLDCCSWRTLWSSVGTKRCFTLIFTTIYIRLRLTVTPTTYPASWSRQTEVNFQF